MKGKKTPIDWDFIDSVSGTPSPGRVERDVQPYFPKSPSGGRNDMRGPSVTSPAGPDTRYGHPANKSPGSRVPVPTATKDTFALRLPENLRANPTRPERPGASSERSALLGPQREDTASSGRGPAEQVASPSHAFRPMPNKTDIASPVPLRPTNPAPPLILDDVGEWPNQKVQWNQSFRSGNTSAGPQTHKPVHALDVSLPPHLTAKESAAAQRAQEPALERIAEGDLQRSGTIGRRPLVAAALNSHDVYKRFSDVPTIVSSRSSMMPLPPQPEPPRTPLPDLPVVEENSAPSFGQPFHEQRPATGDRSNRNSFLPADHEEQEDEELSVALPAGRIEKAEDIEERKELLALFRALVNDPAMPKVELNERAERSMPKGPAQDEEEHDARKQKMGDGKKEHREGPFRKFTRRVSGSGPSMPCRKTDEKLPDTPAFKVALFSNSLSASVNYGFTATKFGSKTLRLPTVALVCTEDLYQRCLQVPGIMITQGNPSQVDRLTAIFDKPPSFGLYHNFDGPEKENPHNVSSVLRRFFNSLPESVVHDSIQLALYACVSSPKLSPPLKLRAVETLLRCLSPEHHALTIYTLAFLAQVVLCEANGVTAPMLSETYGTVLIRPKKNARPSPDQLTPDKSSSILLYFIDHWDELVDGLVLSHVDFKKRLMAMLPPDVPLEQAPQSQKASEQARDNRAPLTQESVGATSDLNPPSKPWGAGIGSPTSTDLSHPSPMPSLGGSLATTQPPPTSHPVKETVVHVHPEAHQASSAKIEEWTRASVDVLDRRLRGIEQEKAESSTMMSDLSQSHKQIQSSMEENKLALSGLERRLVLMESKSGEWLSRHELESLKTQLMAVIEERCGPQPATKGLEAKSPADAKTDALSPSSASREATLEREAARWKLELAKTHREMKQLIESHAQAEQALQRVRSDLATTQEALTKAEAERDESEKRLVSIRRAIGQGF